MFLSNLFRYSGSPTTAVKFLLVLVLRKILDVSQFNFLSVRNARYRPIVQSVWWMFRLLELVPFGAILLLFMVRRGLQLFKLFEYVYCFTCQKGPNISILNYISQTSLNESLTERTEE